MKLNILRANPAGNITLFVLDPVPFGDRAGIAAQLLALPDLEGEQVGFLCTPIMGSAGRMEMAGGEFCGNATRAFGMLVSRQRSGQVLVEVSGCEGPVPVDVDWPSRTARTRMPLPESVRPVQVEGRAGTLVHLGGIAHLVVEGVSPSEEFFTRAEPLFEVYPGLEAYGVIFLNPDRGALVPLVKVPAVGSLVWEGSCGSGSLAAAAAQSQAAPDGLFVRDYTQPAGTIQVSILRRSGGMVSAFIGGPVELGAPVLVEV